MNRLKEENPSAGLSRAQGKELETVNGLERQAGRLEEQSLVVALSPFAGRNATFSVQSALMAFQSH